MQINGFLHSEICVNACVGASEGVGFCSTYALYRFKLVVYYYM